jgi:hypothetical protein
MAAGNMLLGDDDLVNTSTGTRGCATSAGSTNGTVT